MVAQFVEENAFRYHGPLPKPRGLLPVPPEVAEEVAREQVAYRFADSYAKLIRDDRTLVYYYEGEMIAYRIIPAGVEVLAAGPEEVRKFLDETPDKEQQVDPGTEMTTMPAFLAKTWDLPIPKRPVLGLNLYGQEVRSGLLRARVVGMDAAEYVFPCYFLGDPDVPPPTPMKNLLCLSGVINQVRLGFDGTWSPGTPFGILVVEKI